LTEDEAKVYLLQILDALNYIHQKDIIHRDLKPENILFDQFGRLKIGDFGLSHFSAIGNLVNTPCGSPCYASPELLSGHPYDGRTNDIWSVGVILFAMVTGQLPWTKRNQIELFNQIRRGEYRIPPFLSGNCSNLIQRLLTVNPSERITLSQALKHPFLANVQLVQTPTGTVRRMSQEVVERAFGKPKVTSRQAVVAPTKVKGKGVSPKAAKPPVIAKFHGHKRPLTAPSGAGKK
jgi:serine/threonine protein kinase